METEMNVRNYAFGSVGFMMKLFLPVFVLLFSSAVTFDFHVAPAYGEEAGAAIPVGPCWTGSYASIHGDIITYDDYPNIMLVYYNISAWPEPPIDTGLGGPLFPAIYEDTIVSFLYLSYEILFYDVSTGISTTVAHPINDPFNYQDVWIWQDIFYYYSSRALSIYGNIVAFCDTSGFWYYNIATDNFTPIADGVGGVSVYGDTIAFSQEGVIKYYNTTTGVTTNTGWNGTCPSIYGDIIAFQSDSAIMYYNMTGGTATNTGQVGKGPSIYGNTIAYTTGAIIMTYDVVTGTVTNTGWAGVAPSVGNRGIVFVIPDTEFWMVLFLPFPSYDITIDAYCYTEGAYVGVSITMDGTPTGYTTPHTFTDLTGTHTFTVPSSDPNGHPFKQWSTGQTSTTITVSSSGTYTAYYWTPPVVGGIYIPVNKHIPVNKLGLLAPYIALASTILVATAAAAIYVKCRKKRQ